MLSERIPYHMLRYSQLARRMKERSLDLVQTEQSALEEAVEQATH